MSWLANPTPESLVLPESLWAVAGEEQEKRRMEHPWEEVLERYLATSGEDGAAVTVVSSKALMNLALGLDQARARPYEAKQVRQIMDRMGWLYCKVRVDGVQGAGLPQEDGRGSAVGEAARGLCSSRSPEGERLTHHHDHDHDRDHDPRPRHP